MNILILIKKDYLKNIKQRIEQYEFIAHFNVVHTLIFLENYLKNTNSFHPDIFDMIKRILESYCFQKSLINKRGEQTIPDKEFKFYMRILSFLENAYKKDSSNIQILETIIDILVDKLSGEVKFLYKECKPKVFYGDGYTRKTIHLPIGIDIWFLSSENEVLFKNKLHKYSKLLAELNVNFHEPNIIRKSPQIENIPCPAGDSSCFVVTATMGDTNHPRVNIIRNFRDKTLLNYNLGQKFIKWYYQKGPILARIIEKSWVLKKLSYYFMVFPLSEILKRRKGRKN